MAKNDDNETAILKGLAIVGGGFLFVELMKLLGKRKNYYTCTRCQFDKLDYGQKVCPNCKSTLQWPENQ